ncbi:nitrile hydratase [Stella humosa]|uniref:Nitrile hydratase subunit beta n=1 Tax=Stella humosa TaxID=94 RepID=A0A3N1KXD4_9PROT|nr:nitrile hydratase subunit beta [Stella humosa]ROP83887.1 nitrile hydratase [Stella humosa]BBK32851.1 nitrile hydratase [Stella humosa]
MNGAHDLGGVDGFGPVLREVDEPLFHHPWERRAFGITLAAGLLGRWNIDMARFAREDTSPVTYLNATYYEQWLRGLERLLVERGLVGAQELATGVAEGPGAVPAVPAERVPEILARGRSSLRAPPESAPPRFAVGTRVRVRNLHPRGHTRMPRYCRGQVGTIARDHGVHVFPDSNAMGHGEAPQRCYAVGFAARTLWGPDASPVDQVMVDLWDPYLEAA